MLKKDQQLVETAERIAKLLVKEMRDELSPEERQELISWKYSQDESTREFIEQITEWSNIEESLEEFKQYGQSQEAVLQELQDRIREEEAILKESASLSRGSASPILTIPESDISPRPWPWYKWAVAAAMLVAVAVTGILILREKSKGHKDALPIAQRFRNDVAPGGDKALLTLDNGRRIELDNAANGVLADQGGTKVTKLTTGQVAYGSQKTAAPSSTSIAYNTISTPRGGQYQVLLPDGSKVWLNAASSLRFPTVFAGKERLVELTGEAFFQVTRDESRPFKVTVAPSSNASDGGAGTLRPLQVEVLGTEFDLMAYKEEQAIRTTLVTGAVMVRTGLPGGKTEDLQALRLAPGQQASLNNNTTTSKLELNKDADIENAIAWKNGLIRFDDASIETIMSQVARWYDVDVEYQDKIETSQHFYGTIPRSMPISSVLKVLESTGWVHFTIDGKKIVVMK